MSSELIPYNRITHVFLDAGNTLHTIDFDWLGAHLRRLGVACETPELIRAEAASRPLVSSAMNIPHREAGDVYAFYLRTILELLPSPKRPPEPHLAAIVAELGPRLTVRDRERRLWTRVVPGTRAALQALREAGLRLTAVCNASGAAEQELTEQGLRPFLDAVIDSHVVGFKKPDPRIFYHALAVSRAEPACTIHVGDLYNVDVAGARAAGLHAILIDPFDDWRQVDCARVPDLLTFSGQWSQRNRK
jgi:HAD superfamily hydrolase (TIGR01509 family)